MGNPIIDQLTTRPARELIWPGLIALFVLRVVGSFVWGIIYNLYFHPLRKFPGPWLAAWSNVCFSYWFLGGRQPYKILDLHLKYGPVVRVAPNDLSFNTAQSWKDIYGLRHGHKPFVKGTFYEGGNFAGRGITGIVAERDPHRHANMRRLLAHAFSLTSLIEQEELVRGSIDRFIELVKNKTIERGEVFDLTKGYERMTFDIIGDLAFGETFGALETDEPHPWIASLLSSLTKGALMETFQRFPDAARVVGFVLRKQLNKLFEATAKNEDYAIDLVNKRLKRDTTRKDFLTRILEQRDNQRHKVTDLELAAHSWDFVAAGSETTATALSTSTYYLLRNPVLMAKLKDEIRNVFSSPSAINDASTKPLPYLNAVCLEAMRIYPPLPFSLPRIVPEGGDTVDGHFLPPGINVFTNPIAASLDPANFSDPLSFKPERWLDGGKGKDVLDASQPFSLGARGCIGKNLGWMEFRTSLAKVIWHFDLKLANQDLDWHRDSRMHSLWVKPKLLVTAELANHDA